jgi:hypothetical protein
MTAESRSNARELGVVTQFDTEVEKSLTTKDTKSHEGVCWWAVPLCYFVSFVVRVQTQPLPILFADPTNPALRRYFRYHFKSAFCAEDGWTIVIFICSLLGRKINPGGRVSPGKSSSKPVSLDVYI